MTARNFDGWGIRVMVVGQKGKGDTELYSSSGIKYEKWWIKRWSPKLVHSRWVTLKKELSDYLSFFTVMGSFTLIHHSPVF